MNTLDSIKKISEGIQNNLENIKYNFKEPTKENVEIGDLLVIKSRGMGEIVLAPIVMVGDNYIHTKNQKVDYLHAIVIKKDGICLVGKYLTTSYLENIKW